MEIHTTGFLTGVLQVFYFSQLTGSGGLLNKYCNKKNDFFAIAQFSRVLKSDWWRAVDALGSRIDWVDQKQDIFGNLEVFGFVKNLEEFQYFQ